MQSQDDKQSSQKDYSDDVKRVGVKEDIRSTDTPVQPPAEEDQLRVGVKEDIRSSKQEEPDESTQDDDQLRDGKQH